MFIKVKLLNGFREPLWYQKPSEWHDESLLGTIVRVPLRTQHVPALVLKEQTGKPQVPFAIKYAESIEPVPSDQTFNSFIKQLSAYYQINPLFLLKRIRSFVHQTHQNVPEKEYPHKEIKAVSLTDEQQRVVDFITPKIINPEYTPTVIHGVTGSGKTEIYKQLIQTALAQHKNALLLLPEVTLAIEFESRLRAELPNTMPIFSFHSGTSIKNKRVLWQNLLENKPMLIIGVHIPVLLPIPQLGIIIVDEEHEVGYQEKKHPKINSKEAALLRAKLNNIPIVLGSATPSFATLHNIKKRGWHFFELRKRFAGKLPTIQTVFLSDKKQRKNFWISKKLSDAIKDRLEKKEQIIIFINRRGYSFFVQCKECSYIPACPSCSVSLTLHSDDMLNCHYCQYALKHPDICPQCKKDRFIKKGIGTQQAVSILEELYPQARIARADMDTTQKKKLWQQTMQGFASGEIDILVGTQTITKGYHFPNVTLVGILWADLNLHFPIYNAAETTLQQLIQVAGRAGRQTDESLVIVQAMQDHSIFQFLNEVDYLKFYTQEIESRSMIGYPPCNRLVEIELKYGNEATIEKEAHDLLAGMLAKNSKTVQILGPAKPPVHKIKNMFSRKIYLKSENIQDMIELFRSIDQHNYMSSIFFCPNPVA